MTRQLINRVTPGKVDVGYPESKRYQPLFIDILVDETDGKTRLSITGVEGPRNNGDAWGSAGQCRDSLAKLVELAPGWTTEMAFELFAVWERWHLNDLRAGTPAQEAWLREHPVTFTYPESHYTKALEALTRAGLNPDDGYRYGSAWLYEEVPTEVIEWLRNLPAATFKYPDAWAH